MLSFLDAYESVNAPVARHEAVRRWMEEREQVVVPGKLWPCAGPGLVEAVEIIRGAVK